MSNTAINASVAGVFSFVVDRGGSAAGRHGRTPKRGRASLAALPDPDEQDRLHAEASARVRSLVADAAAAGEPLVDANGNRRSHVTLPEFRQGRAPANKGRRYPAEILTTDEVLAILDELPKGHSKTGPRSRALIIVMWRAGLRIAEALALEPRDIDLALGTIVVRSGKGAKRRVVAIDAMTRRHLAELLDRRAQFGLDTQDLRERLCLADGQEVPVFCTLAGAGRGRPLHPSTVREMLKLYARKAGIRKRVHPHGLRHTFAFELSQEGIPVALIQQQLGHEDLAMTDHYIRHLAPAHLIERIGARACPGELEPPAQTYAALSAGEPAPLGGHHEPRRERSRRVVGAAYLGVQRRVRLENAMLEALGDGARSTRQLADTCAITPENALRILHRMHNDRRIARVGMDPQRGGILWKRAPRTTTSFTMQKPRAYAPKGEPLPRMIDAIAALGGRASQAELGRLLGLAPATVQGYCRELEARGAIERGGLDKTTSRRGSQVWRLPESRIASYGVGAGGGYTLTLRLPARS